MLPSCVVAGTAARAAAAAAAAAVAFSSATHALSTTAAGAMTTAAVRARLAPSFFRVAAYSSAATATTATRGAAASATAAKAAPPTTKGNATRAGTAASPSNEGVVPDVLVTFGNQADRMTFVSHPGVMAVAKLLEMTFLTEHRAVLTQQNVDAIREYDEELAKKAQVAVDSGLAVNFQKLDFFDRPDFVEMFEKEKELLQKARAEVFAAPKGQYTIPACVASHTPIEIPRRWRTDLELTEEMVRVDPELRAQTELRSLIIEHLSQKEVPERALPSSSQQQPPPRKQIS